MDFAVFAEISKARLRAASTQASAVVATAQAEKTRVASKQDALELSAIRHGAEMKRREQQAQTAVDSCKLAGLHDQRKRLVCWRIARSLLMAAHRERARVRLL